MRAPFIALLALVTLAGCGSSIRLLEQSRTYFERCHAADLDPGVELAVKEECWGRWLEDYSEGQSPEVLTYAQGRKRALSSGGTLPPLPGMGGAEAPAAPAEGRVELVLESTPEGSALVSCGVRPEPAAPRCPSPPGLDEGPCAEVCNPRWYGCAGQCTAPDRRCLEACEVEYRTCMGACY